MASFVAGYLALWLYLAGFHYATGDVVQSAITLVVFVVPVVGLALWRVGKTYYIENDEFDIDVAPISS